MADFVELSVEQLPELLEKLKQHMPDTLPIIHAADNVVRGRFSLDDVQFYVDTWPHPTCVALLSPAHTIQLHNYRTTVDLWSENIQSVVGFLQCSNVLDWSQPMFFRAQDMSQGELEAVQTVLSDHKGKWTCVERHIYVHDSPPTLERIQLPEGCTLQDQLSMCDAETVGHQYIAWGVEPSQAVRYFQHCCTHLPCSGVHTQDGQLVAYAVLHHTSALGSVVTAPHHQRKGMGAAVVTDVCRKIRADGQIPYVYVNPENIASAALYSKCGFECRARAFRIRFVPEE